MFSPNKTSNIPQDVCLRKNIIVFERRFKKKNKYFPNLWSKKKKKKKQRMNSSDTFSPNNTTTKFREYCREKI